jgi:ketosteroid isomerase-like protein
MKQGQYKTALARVDQLVATKPKDAQARFTKGVILTELNRPSEAIQVYQKLTEDYPALPEPYNNLAVIYASQKQYEKARDALEQAIHTHPAYATAHENLGDIYAKLASQAYDKALQLESPSMQAQPKLAALRDLTTTGGVPSAAPVALAAATPAKPAASAPVVTVAPKPLAPVAIVAPKPAAPTEPIAKASPVVAASKPVQVAAAAASKPIQIAAATQAVAVPAKPAAKPEAAASVAEAAKAPVVEKTSTKAAQKETKPEADSAASEVAAVSKAVHEWAAAWSRKDVRTYLGFYAKEFRTPNGQARNAWEDEREARITKPGPIEVGVVGLKVSIDGDTATARFRQAYSSTNLKTTSTKTLVLGRRGSRWQILQERVGA